LLYITSQFCLKLGYLYFRATGDKSELPVIPDTRTCNVTDVAGGDLQASSVELIERKLADVHMNDEVDSSAVQRSFGMDDELKRGQDVPDCVNAGALEVASEKTTSSAHLGNDENGDEDHEGICAHWNDSSRGKSLLELTNDRHNMGMTRYVVRVCWN